MHTDTRQLLALIDGEPIDTPARQHALSCGACQSEVDRLQRTRARLRALPTFEPPPLASAVVRATAERKRWPRRLAAAGVLLAAMLTAVMATQREAQAPTAVVAAAVSERAAPSGFEPDAERVVPGLTSRSAQLEREWRALSAHAGAVRRVGHESDTSRIKNRLLQLDTRFAAGGGHEYWNQRVQLLDSLVDIERAELLAQSDRAYEVLRVSHRQPQGAM